MVAGWIDGFSVVGGWWDGFKIAAVEALGWWGVLILIVVLFVGALIMAGYRRVRREDTVEDEDFEYYKVLGPL